MHLSVGYKRKKLAKLRFVLLFITIVSLSLSVNADATSVETPNLTPPLDVLWEYKFDGACNAIVASNDSVYVASNQIYAFNADTGGVTWKYNASGTALDYYSNMVYAGDTSIYALNANDGTLKWSHKINGSLDDIFVKNNVLYATAHGSEGESSTRLRFPYYIYALNIHTGELVRIWEVEWIFLNREILPVLYTDNDTIAIANLSDNFMHVYGFNTSNYELKWNFEIIGGYKDLPKYTPAIYDDSAYFCHPKKGLQSLNLSMGELNWVYEVEEEYVGDIEVNNESVYFCYKNELYSLNKSTGKLNWRFKTRDTYKTFNSTSLKIENTPYYTYKVYLLNKKVYLYSRNYCMYSIDLTGSLNWKFQSSDIPTLFQSDDKLLYIAGGRDGHFYIIEIDTGKLVQDIKAGDIGIRDVKKVDINTFHCKKDGSKIYYVTPNRWLGLQSSKFPLLSTLYAFSSEKMVAPHAVEVAQLAIDASKDNINVTGAHELLERAKESLTKGDYSNATKYANKAKESAILPFITSAEFSIKWCNFLHADGSKAEKLLENAKNAYMTGDFSNAINQAVEAKESANEAMKTRAMLYILVLSISFICIAILHRYGMLIGISTFIKLTGRYRLMSMLLGFFYLCLSVYFANSIICALISKKSIPMGLLFILFILVMFLLYSLHRESIKVASIIFYLGVFISVYILGLYIAIKGGITYAFIHNFESPLVEIIILSSYYLRFIGMASILILGVFIILSLGYLVYLFVKYRKIMKLYEKANEYERLGEHINVIEYANKALSMLKEMKGFFLKKDPFYKESVRDCYRALSQHHCVTGNYDNAVKNLRNIRDLDNETVDSIYRGESDILELITEINRIRFFENNIFKKYLKIKSLIKKPAILQKIKFEHTLVISLISIFGLYIYRILTIDYRSVYLSAQRFLELNQIFTWICFCFLLIFSLVLLLFMTLKIEKGYSENIFDLFNRSQTKDILSKEQKLKSTYKLLCFSLVLICLLYAVQSTNWFNAWILFLSRAGFNFIFISIVIPIISFVYLMLIISTFADFIGDTCNRMKHYGKESPDVFDLFSFAVIASCLLIFASTFTIFLNSQEGIALGFIQQSLPLFIIATALFIFSLNWVYQEFNTGSNKLIGDTYHSKGEYKKACDRYKKIEKHVNKKFYKAVFPPSDTFLSNLYMAYGDSKFRLGEREEALSLLNKSLEFAEKGNLTSYLWQIHYKIGQIKEEGNKLEEAYESYKKSIDIIEDLRELVKIPERKETFFEDKAEVYAKRVFLCLRLNKDEEAFNYAERAKGRVFLELLGTEKVEVRVRPELKEKEELKLRKIREIEAKLRERQEERYLWELSKVMEEYDELLLKIKEEDLGYYSLRKVEPQALQEIQSLLTENELILEFFVGDEVIAFIIQKDGLSVEKMPITKKELETKIKDIRKKINPLQMLSVKRVANELYQILIRKSEPLLNGKDLIIVPHGILHYLPFNALYDGKSWFIEKYNARFLQNASMQQFLKEKRKERIRNVLVVGNPTKDLEYAEKEAIDVAHKFNVNPLLRDEAKKEIVIESSINKDLLHLSCHAKFEAGFPRFSRLMLADDNLLVTEVYNLDLNADLVTLSACETGLGGLTNGDEVEGLTRAFMRAGTPSVIASLWEVDAVSTSELFLKFYEGEGDKMKRLRDAQIEIMKKYGHPYYWAGFVMFGEG